jgi:hypothetical protein
LHTSSLPVRRQEAPRDWHCASHRA